MGGLPRAHLPPPISFFQLLVLVLIAACGGMITNRYTQVGRAQSLRAVLTGDKEGHKRSGALRRPTSPCHRASMVRKSCPLKTTLHLKGQIYPQRILRHIGGIELE